MKRRFYQQLLLASLISMPVTACYAKKGQAENGANKPENSVVESADPVDEGSVMVYPTELSGPISNPGMGVETFHNNWGATLSTAQYPEAGIDYYRFYWNELEPVEGQYAFDKLDRILAENRQESPAKMIAIRFMTADEPYTGSKIPSWLINKGIAGDWSEDGSTFVPSLEDSVYMSYMAKLLNAFGQRYDGNPNLSHVDIGMVGSWGEWHNSNFANLAPLHQRYSDATLNHIVDLHFQAFPKTPKVMLISGENSLNYAVSKGAGWRADCWGDWHHFSTTWSHMKDDYPYRLQQAEQKDNQFKEAWQHGPISLETCGTMQEWRSAQAYTLEEVQASLDWAIAHHASSLNLKSKPIPEAYRPLLDNALSKLGYRLRIKSLSHQQWLSAGSTWVIETLFSNDGVAPPYVHRNLAYRLRNSEGETVFSAISKYDVNTWLPGEHATRTSLTLPDDLERGDYAVEVALIDSHGELPLNLANDGKQASGWYRLSQLSIQ
ncbi:DUF4832 domain-containing protein [Vibrio vulnificus]|nr:DUF4832 domain-containing protein [Vibrio vulnificus]